jgi:hypothetical protein
MTDRRLQSIPLGLLDGELLKFYYEKAPKGHIFLDGAKWDTRIYSAVVTQRRMRDFEK